MLLSLMYLFSLLWIEHQSYSLKISAKEEKIKKLELIAKDTVDINGIGFYTLGAARKKFKVTQRKKEYIEIIWRYIFWKAFLVD